MEIPPTVSEDLKKIGGLRSIYGLIPERRRLKEMSKIFQSLSDPIRLSILYALSSTPLCVCIVKSIMKITDSKLSYHLSHLRSAGLITQQSEGRFLVYKITDRGKQLISICNKLD